MMKFSMTGLALLGAMAATPIGATNSPVELKSVLNRLMSDLPGEYDSEPQRFFEAEYKTPLEQQHSRVYRRFVQLNAPQLGVHVLLASVRAGDKSAALKWDEFLVWTLRVDEDRKAVRMSPHRFRNPEQFAAVAPDDAQFNKLTTADLVSATGTAAGCDILWRQVGTQLRGRNDPGSCHEIKMHPKRVSVRFDWEWLLAEEELWINYSGTDPNGRRIAGRPDQTHWRLMKARTFECFLAYRPSVGPEQVHNGLKMHDRGDVLRLELQDGATRRPVFLQLTRGVWPSNSGRNYVDLLRFSLQQGRPEDPPASLKQLGSSIAGADSDRAGFTIGPLSARCKLSKSRAD